MKSIWYCSSLQQEKFSNNTRSQFTNNFDVDDLISIADDEIEVAIKNIYFDEDNIEEKSKHSLIKNRQRVYGDKVLAIRSNICQASILNGGYEKELCHFKVNREHHFEFINPTFFKTTKDLLANATFSIIDVKSKDIPDWNIGSPTYIQAIVRSKMTDSFSVYLDSDDKNSINNKTNSNMNFTIDLPQRLYLDKWEVCLKSIILPCRIWNIYEEYKIYWETTYEENGEIKNSYFEVQDGCYGIEDILHLIKMSLSGIQVSYQRDSNRVNIGKKGKLCKKDTILCKLSPYLAKILGFTKDFEEEEEDYVIVFYSNYLKISRFSPNINLLSPKTIIVVCNIVEATIFGGECVKVLKVIPNKMERNGDVVQYEFLQDEYVNLGINEFDRIQISICDVSGDNLNVDYKEIPTRLQLEFRKPRSLKEPLHSEY